MSVRTKAIGLTFLTVGSAIIGIYFWPEEVTVSELDKVDFPQENIPSNSPTLVASKEDHQEEEKKVKIREKARKAFARMNDYSFKIFSPCGKGTGWVLDYEIPKNGGYPKVWYIATNAHVISKYRFSENPYRQELPISDQETSQLRQKWKLNKKGGIQIQNTSLWGNYSSCDSVDWYGYFGWSIGKAENGKELEVDKDAIARGKMKEPKLFYAAIDFLEANEAMGISAHHYKDFAVLEVEFTDEAYARAVTNNFADKYNLETTDAINVFDKSLDEKYSKDELEKLDENFYGLAYPLNGNDRFSYQISWDEENAEGSRLSNDPYNLHHSYGQERRNGYVSAKRHGKYLWNGKKREEVGYDYLLKGFPMGGGSSGGLYTDGDGNLLGIKVAIDSDNPYIRHSFVSPLRTKEIITDTFKSPAYDLILGGIQGQKTSYRQQVEEYKKDTFLSRRGWKHKSPVNAKSQIN